MSIFKDMEIDSFNFPNTVPSTQKTSTYLFLNNAEPHKKYHILLIEISGVPFEVPSMIWLCEDRANYSETDITTACIKAFPEYLEVLACDSAKYKLTWLADELKLYIDNIMLFRNMLDRKTD